MPTDFTHSFVEHHGLFAIFVGCLLEGESAAILGGFFAHQDVLVPWQVFATAYAGAFCGDMILFFAGKYFSSGSLIQRLEQKPAFSYAQRMIGRYPTLYVLLNRYVYGLRLVGGIVAGVAGIKTTKFLLLNAVSTLVWASIFTGIGYVFGTAAEEMLGSELAKHERLLIALGVGLATVLLGWYVLRRLRKRARRQVVGDRVWK